MNALARRDVAIVTDQPGTTRDVLEVHLDLGGAAVNLIDTAGIRDAENAIEAEGIRRGRSRASGSDFVLWLDEAGEGPADGEIPAGVSCKVLRTKADLDAGIVNASLSPSGDVFPAAVSALTGAGLDRLIDAIADLAGSSAAGEPALVSRERQRRCLDEAVKGLDDTLASAALPEVAADHLRRASDAIGRLTGRIDIEDVLGSIFSSFCIGK
jgi:tRNA modification GTPase